MNETAKQDDDSMKAQDTQKKVVENPALRAYKDMVLSSWKDDKEMWQNSGVKSPKELLHMMVCRSDSGRAQGMTPEWVSSNVVSKVERAMRLELGRIDKEFTKAPGDVKSWDAKEGEVLAEMKSRWIPFLNKVKDILSKYPALEIEEPEEEFRELYGVEKITKSGSANAKEELDRYLDRMTKIFRDLYNMKIADVYHVPIESDFTEEEEEEGKTDSQLSVLRRFSKGLLKDMERELDSLGDGYESKDQADSLKRVKQSLEESVKGSGYIPKEARHALVEHLTKAAKSLNKEIGSAQRDLDEAVRSVDAEQVDRDRAIVDPVDLRMTESLRKALPELSNLYSDYNEMARFLQESKVSGSKGTAESDEKRRKSLGFFTGSVEDLLWEEGKNTSRANTQFDKDSIKSNPFHIKLVGSRPSTLGGRVESEDDIALSEAKKALDTLRGALGFGDRGVLNSLLSGYDSSKSPNTGETLAHLFADADESYEKILSNNEKIAGHEETLRKLFSRGIADKAQRSSRSRDIESENEKKSSLETENSGLIGSLLKNISEIGTVLAKRQSARAATKLQHSVKTLESSDLDDKRSRAKMKLLEARLKQLEGIAATPGIKAGKNLETVRSLLASMEKLRSYDDIISSVQEKLSSGVLPKDKAEERLSNISEKRASLLSSVKEQIPDLKSDLESLKELQYTTKPNPFSVKNLILGDFSEEGVKDRLVKYGVPEEEADTIVGRIARYRSQSKDLGTIANILGSENRAFSKDTESSDILGNIQSMLSALNNADRSLAEASGPEHRQLSATKSSTAEKLANYLKSTKKIIDASQNRAKRFLDDNGIKSEQELNDLLSAVEDGTGRFYPPKVIKGLWRLSRMDIPEATKEMVEEMGRTGLSSGSIGEGSDLRPQDLESTAPYDSALRLIAFLSTALSGPTRTYVRDARKTLALEVSRAKDAIDGIYRDSKLKKEAKKVRGDVYGERVDTIDLFKMIFPEGTFDYLKANALADRDALSGARREKVKKSEEEMKSYKVAGRWEKASSQTLLDKEIDPDKMVEQTWAKMRNEFDLKKNKEFPGYQELGSEITDLSEFVRRLKTDLPKFRKDLEEVFSGDRESKSPSTREFHYESYMEKVQQELRGLEADKPISKNANIIRSVSSDLKRNPPSVEAASKAILVWIALGGYDPLKNEAVQRKVSDLEESLLRFYGNRSAAISTASIFADTYSGQIGEIDRNWKSVSDYGDRIEREISEANSTMRRVYSNLAGPMKELTEGWKAVGQSGALDIAFRGWQGELGDEEKNQQRLAASEEEAESFEDKVAKDLQRAAASTVNRLKALADVLNSETYRAFESRLMSLPTGPEGRSILPGSDAFKNSPISKKDLDALILRIRSAQQSKSLVEGFGASFVRSVALAVQKMLKDAGVAYDVNVSKMGVKYASSSSDIVARTLVPISIVLRRKAAEVMSGASSPSEALKVASSILNAAGQGSTYDYHIERERERELDRQEKRKSNPVLWGPLASTVQNSASRIANKISMFLRTAKDLGIDKDEMSDEAFIRLGRLFTESFASLYMDIKSSSKAMGMDLKDLGSIKSEAAQSVYKSLLPVDIFLMNKELTSLYAKASTYGEDLGDVDRDSDEYYDEAVSGLHDVVRILIKAKIEIADGLQESRKHYFDAATEFSLLEKDAKEIHRRIGGFLEGYSSAPDKEAFIKQRFQRFATDIEALHSLAMRRSRSLEGKGDKNLKSGIEELMGMADIPRNAIEAVKRKLGSGNEVGKATLNALAQELSDHHEETSATMKAFKEREESLNAAAKKVSFDSEIDRVREDYAAERIDRDSALKVLREGMEMMRKNTIDPSSLVSLYDIVQENEGFHALPQNLRDSSMSGDEKSRRDLLEFINGVVDEVNSYLDEKKTAKHLVKSLLGEHELENGELGHRHTRKTDWDPGFEHLDSVKLHHALSMESLVKVATGSVIKGVELFDKEGNALGLDEADLKEITDSEGALTNVPDAVLESLGVDGGLYAYKRLEDTKSGEALEALMVASSNLTPATKRLPSDVVRKKYEEWLEEAKRSGDLSDSLAEGLGIEHVWLEDSPAKKTVLNKGTINRLADRAQELHESDIQDRLNSLTNDFSMGKKGINLSEALKRYDAVRRDAKKFGIDLKDPSDVHLENPSIRADFFKTAGISFKKAKESLFNKVDDLAGNRLSDANPGSRDRPAKGLGMSKMVWTEKGMKREFFFNDPLVRKLTFQAADESAKLGKKGLDVGGFEKIFDVIINEAEKSAKERFSEDTIQANVNDYSEELELMKNRKDDLAKALDTFDVTVKAVAVDLFDINEDLKKRLDEVREEYWDKTEADEGEGEGHSLSDLLSQDEMEMWEELERQVEEAQNHPGKEETTGKEAADEEPAGDQPEKKRGKAPIHVRKFDRKIDRRVVSDIFKLTRGEKAHRALKAMGGFASTSDKLGYNFDMVAKRLQDTNTEASQKISRIKDEIADRLKVAEKRAIQYLDKNAPDVILSEQDIKSMGLGKSEEKDLLKENSIKRVDAFKRKKEIKGSSDYQAMMKDFLGKTDKADMQLRLLRMQLLESLKIATEKVSPKSAQESGVSGVSPNLSFKLGDAEELFNRVMEFYFHYKNHLISLMETYEKNILRLSGSLQSESALLGPDSADIREEQVKQWTRAAAVDLFNRIEQNWTRNLNDYSSYFNVGFDEFHDIFAKAQEVLGTEVRSFRFRQIADNIKQAANFYKSAVGAYREDLKKPDSRSGRRFDPMAAKAFNFMSNPKIVKADQLEKELEDLRKQHDRGVIGDLEYKQKSEYIATMKGQALDQDELIKFMKVKAKMVDDTVRRINGEFGRLMSRLRSGLGAIQFRVNMIEALKERGMRTSDILQNSKKNAVAVVQSINQSTDMKKFEEDIDELYKELEDGKNELTRIFEERKSEGGMPEDEKRWFMDQLQNVTAMMGHFKEIMKVRASAKQASGDAYKRAVALLYPIRTGSPSRVASTEVKDYSKDKNFNPKILHGSLMRRTMEKLLERGDV